MPLFSTWLLIPAVLILFAAAVLRTVGGSESEAWRVVLAVGIVATGVALTLVVAEIL